jgi:hypothetical protein
MKRLLLLMLTLLTLGFVAAPVSAQNTLTVADGTETNAYVPVYGWYADAYQRCQIIYPESMLTDMLNNAITEISFYLTASPSLSSTYEVKIGTCTETTFSGSFLTSPASSVYSGGLPVVNDMMTIELETPFTYTGGNLLVEFTTLSTGNYPNTAYYGITSSGSSVSGYNYSGVSSVSPSDRNFLPKTTFSYGTPSLCAKPTNVTASSITTSGATISWTGDANASSYNIEYMPSSSSDWTNALTATSSTNTVDLSGLNPSSSYKVRVQTACSDNTETNWSAVCSFMTACDAILITETTPWFEDFEGYQGGGEQPFQCWATPVTAAGGGPFVYCGHAPACHSGANSAELKGANQMLVLPEFSNDIHDLRLSFWATAVTPSNGTLEIGVLPDMDDLNSFEVLGLSGTPSSRDGVGNYMGPFDFNGIQASSGRIAFRYVSSGTGNSWNLDDFTVELSPTCTSPVKTSVTATGIDGHNATISFVDNDDTHNSWTLYYKMNTQTDNDWQSVTLYDTFYTLTGLAPETTYNVYVVTNCSGTPGTDATITYDFTTEVACPAPTAVTASPVYINDATITWTSTATTFNIEYGETGFSQGSGTTETVYDNTITLTSLNAETSYTVYVQADCGTDDGMSQWSSVQFTTLPSCPAPTQVAANNITSNSADIVWTAGYQEGEWELRYGPENFNPDTSSVSEIITGTELFQMQNLPADTRYDIYVRAICSGTDTSAWSSRLTFKTQCEAATLPLVEDFESVSDWGTPTCWQKFESPSMSGWAAVRNENAYSGSKSLHVEGNYNATSYGFMRLPNLDVDDISTLQVKLMARKSSGSRELIVGIIPEFFSVDSIYVAGSFTDLTSDYTEKIVSFEDFPGTTGYIIIGTPAGIGSSTVFNVDNLTVEVRPNCMYPTNFATTNVGENFVTLSWTELGTAESWNIEYGPMGYTQGNGTIESSDSTHHTVEGLSASTAYDFYVQSDCGSLGSEWVGPITVVTSQHMFGVTGIDTISTCGMALYDDGGPNGTYSINCNYTLVINPATEGSGLSVTGSVNTYNASSYYAGVVTIYAGQGTAGEVLGSFSGVQNVNVAYAGPITINFTSGSYYSGAGFELIVQCTECFPPSNVTLSNITMTGVTVDWSGAASEYAVYAMSATDTAYATTTDTSYTFTTLNSSSTYKVYVRSLCGSDSSLLSSMVSFNTACDQITITETTPWTENFEGYTGGGERPFVCWETPVTSPGGGPFVYCGYAQSAHSGANTAELKGNTNLLVLPDFSNDIHDLRLSFWATSYGSGTSAEIGVVTDILDPTTFELLGDAGTPGPRGNQDGVSGNGNFMGPFDFNGIQATSGRIAIRFTGSGNSSGWNLDDFTVSLAPGCPSPVKTSVQATNIDGHNATITFVDNDTDHNSWTVYYKESTATTWNSEVTYTQSATLTGLDPETTYDVYVITNCTTPDDVTDSTFAIQFTTAVACPAPTNLAASNVGMNTATISWTSNADSFTIEYTEAGGAPVTVTSTTNSVDLTGLTTGTTYAVSVTADCGAEGYSQAATMSFNTSLCDVTDQCVYTFNLADSYGDGWNGGSITVKQNNIPVATFGLTSGSSATETVSLCHGVSTTVEWSAGSYANEASFSIVGPDNAELYASPTMNQYSTYSFMPNCSGCPMPTALTVSNITTTSATISWTGTADSYTVEYGVAGFTPGAGTTTTTTGTTMDLTGLTAATAYTVYITSTCGTDASSAAVLNFATTMCNASDQCTYTLALTDSYGDGWNSSYMTVVQNGITVATINMTSGSSATETILLCDNLSTSIVWNSVGSFDDEAGFTLTGPDGSQLYTYDDMEDYTTFTFTTNCSGSGPVLTDPTVATQAATAISQTAATLNGTITNPDNVTITEKGFEWMPLMGTDYTHVVVTGNDLTYNLTNLTPNTDYIFKAFITFNGTTVYGNDLIFTTLEQGQLTEPSATTAAATNVTQTTATLNGSISNPDNVTITAQGFEWKAAAAASYTTVNATGATMTHNLTGLTANTAYTYRAFVTTANGTHYGADVNFTTQEGQVEPCETPTNLHASEFDAHSITIGWNANGNATSWNIHYRVADGTWSNASSTTNTYVINGLAAETIYEIEVQADCGSDNLSDWSSSIHICTAIDGINSWLANSVSLYPNPAKEYVDIRVDGELNVKMMEVYDVYGKLINTVNVIENPTRINVSSLANGMYFVRVTTEEGVVTKTFVKR